MKHASFLKTSKMFFETIDSCIKECMEQYKKYGNDASITISKDWILSEYDEIGIMNVSLTGPHIAVEYDNLKYLFSVLSEDFDLQVLFIKQRWVFNHLKKCSLDKFIQLHNKFESETHSLFWLGCIAKDLYYTIERTKGINGVLNETLKLGVIGQDKNFFFRYTSRYQKRSEEVILKELSNAIIGIIENGHLGCW